MTVPKDLEEAARIDGASWFQLYTRVVIPYILPVIQSVAIIGIIACLKQMEQESVPIAAPHWQVSNLSAPGVERLRGRPGEFVSASVAP